MDLIASLPWWALAWVVFVTIASGFVHGALGFGYPLIAMPLLSLVLDSKTTILIVIVPAFVLSCANVIFGGRWSESIARLWYLPIAIMAGAFLGTRIVITSDPAPYVLLLAAVLLLYLNSDRIGAARLDAIKRYPVAATLVFGFAGGWLESSTNMNLPVLLILFKGLALGPLAVVQLANFAGIGGKSAQIAGWWSGSGLSIGFWAAMLPWVGIAALALAAGYQVRSRIETKTYRRWLRAFLWVMAFALLAQFAAIMWGRLR
ncbi:MAG: TSUP family transporter [Burkholderiales bacterium]